MLGMQYTNTMQASDTEGCKRLCGALRALLRIVHSKATYAVPSVGGDVVEPLSEKKPCVTTTSQLPLPTLPRGRQLSEVACAACSSPDHVALGAPCDAMLGFSGKRWDTSGCNCPGVPWPQSAKMPPANLHTMVVSLGVDWAVVVYWPCMLTVAALALAFGVRGGNHSHQCRLANSVALRSNQSAPVLGCYNRRPLINAMGITSPTTALLMLSALATAVATQPAPPWGPPPPPRPGSEELDGWRRFPSRTNHTVQALLTPQCMQGGNLPVHVGCISVPRSGMVARHNARFEHADCTLGTIVGCVRLPHTSPGAAALHGGGDTEVTFTSSGVSFSGAAARSFALDDANADGRLDVLVGNYANELLLQQSDGSFVAAAGFPCGSADTQTVALGDVDGNGRLDVPVGNYGVANELLIFSSCPNGGAPLHATSACFACPSFIGRSSDSADCRECPPDSISERVFGTGERCVIPCSLGERPLGFNTFTACKAIAGSYSDFSVKRDPKDSSTWAAPSCASCPSGKRADSATGAVCLPCVPGQFASNTASCDVCPAGSYSAGLESTSCTPCPSLFAPDDKSQVILTLVPA